MRGALGWSGTDYIGTTFQSLTTTQRDALSPSNGAVIYNTTTAQFERREAGAWLGSGTINTNEITQSALVSSAAVALDFDGAGLQTLSLSHDPTFTTANRATAGFAKSIAIKIDPNGSARTPTFPAWTWLNATPTSFTVGKISILSLTAAGAAEGDVLAVFLEQL
jgi:hypothetical protein